MPTLHGRKANGIVNVRQNTLFSGDVQFNSGWGTLYYVDPTNGADTNDGFSASYPFKTPRYALTIAGAFDTIFIKPAVPNSAGGDPTSITPDTAANWHVPYTSHGLSIIGCGVGHGLSGSYMTNLKGYTAVLSTPTLLVSAPYVNLENLTFRVGSTNTGGGLNIKGDFSTNLCFGNTVYNCTFWKAPSTATTGGLCIDGAWYTSVINSHFVSCYVGLNLFASVSDPVGVNIVGCDWQGLTTEVSCDIYGNNKVINILMKDLVMNHALPAAGAPNLYVDFVAASTGMWAGGYIGATSSAVATNTTLNGVGYSGVLCGPNKSFMATA
jgi:hypothetical protein